MWIAREKSGKLHLFRKKPIRIDTYGTWIWGNQDDCLLIDSELYNIQWEDEPVEVFIFAKEFIQSFGDACYEQGEKDACHFEYGEPEEGNLIIDEYITKNICG